VSGEQGLLVFIIIPLVVVWAVVMVDIALQPRLSGVAKVVWAVLCTVVWPLQIAYLLIRPNRGRVERDEGRTDRHAQLVAAVLDHEAGRIDEAQMREVAARLRQPS
jgi:uncharacterized membrane protein (UPF0182 family)